MAVVAILALDGVVGFELTLPGQVFGTANMVTAAPTYEIRVVSNGPSVRTSSAFGSLRLEAPWDLDSLEEADTVLIPAQEEFWIPPPDPVLEALCVASARDLTGCGKTCFRDWFVSGHDFSRAVRR